MLSTIVNLSWKMANLGFSFVFSAKWKLTSLCKDYWNLRGTTSLCFGYHIHGIWNCNAVWPFKRFFEKVRNRKMQCSCRAKRTKGTCMHLPGVLSMSTGPQSILRSGDAKWYGRTMIRSGTMQGHFHSSPPTKPIPLCSSTCL